jgi:hypothetical protein
MFIEAKKDRYTSIKVIPFNWKQNEWSPWEEKYLARAKHKGSKSILLGQETILTAGDVLIPGDSSDPKDDSKDSHQGSQ